MGVIYQYEHEGMDGGKWYAASYPMGATRYYATLEARTIAVAAYSAAIEKTGGRVIVL